MNMKKTMAALAACAVAVSAMATTVSAVEDQTLAYDLTAAIKETTAGNVNITGALAGVTVTAQTPVVIGFDKIPAGYKMNTMTLTFKDQAGNAGSKVFNYDFRWGKDNWYPEWNLTGGQVTIGADSLPAGSYDVTVTANFTHPYAQYAGDVSKCVQDFAAINFTDGTVTNNSFTGNGFVDVTVKFLQSPMETKLDKNWNVINYLQTQNVNGDENSYKNVGPVLNDAIENYETVTFKFNSAKEYVRFGVDVDGVHAKDAKTKAGAYNEINNKIAELSIEVGKLEAAEAAAKTAAEADPSDDDLAAAYTAAKAATLAAKEEVADWKAAEVFWYYTPNDWEGTDYSKFTQHLYNGISYENYFKAEGTNYLGLDWAGYNLFQGGLVINEGYTMSLADTTMFDWGESSVSFDWDTIADAAQTSNSYALYLHSMELATSVEWYWDSLDVILTAGAVDDATSDAGATADDEVLEDEEIEEEVTEEEIVEEEIVEEEVEEEVVEEVEVENPTTGNASVALAVIPVALAAAAVVAKKRS